MTQQVASDKKAQLLCVSTCVCTLSIIAFEVCEAVTADRGHQPAGNSKQV